MITLQQTPGTIALSRNDMLFSFLAKDASGAAYGAMGARSEFKMNGAGIVIGEQIIINYTDASGVITSLTFVAVASPVTPLEIEGSPTGLITDHYNNVLTKIGAHPDLQPFLSFTGDFGLSFLLKATAIDTNINIVVSWDISSLMNAYALVDYIASSSSAPIGYEVVVDLMFEKVYGSGVFERIVGLESGPGADGKVTFNIKGIIDDEIKKSFEGPNIPTFDQATPYVADNIRNYYVRFREDWVGNTESTWNNDVQRKALCGGIAQNLYADYGFTINETSSFLTYIVEGKTLSPDQPEWLAWYNYTAGTRQVYLRLIVTNEDGSETESFVYQNNQFLVPANEIGLFPVGYDQLGITGDKQHYRVEVLSSTQAGTTSFSPLRSYYVDHAYYEEKRFIMYLNGFCCPETIRCIGEHTTDLEIKRSKSDHVLSPNYTSLHSEVEQQDQEFTNYFTYRTGYIRDVDAHALQEWLIYNDGYEVYEQGYIPLDIKGSKFNIVETRKSLNAFAIKAKPRMRSKNYSNINIPLSVEQIGWAIQGGGFWKIQFGTNWQIA